MKGRDFFRNDDLTALRPYRHAHSDHRRQPCIAESGGQHHFACADFASASVEPEFSATRLDAFDRPIGQITAAAPLEGDMERAQQAQCIHMAIERTKAGAGHIRPNLG